MNQNFDFQSKKKDYDAVIRFRPDVLNTSDLFKKKFKTRRLFNYKDFEIRPAILIFFENFFNHMKELVE